MWPGSALRGWLRSQCAGPGYSGTLGPARGPPKNTQQNTATKASKRRVTKRARGGPGPAGAGRVGGCAAQLPHPRCHRAASAVITSRPPPPPVATATAACVAEPPHAPTSPSRPAEDATRRSVGGAYQNPSNKSRGSLRGGGATGGMNALIGRGVFFGGGKPFPLSSSGVADWLSWCSGEGGGAAHAQTRAGRAA